MSVCLSVTFGGGWAVGRGDGEGGQEGGGATAGGEEEGGQERGGQWEGGISTRLEVRWGVAEEAVRVDRKGRETMRKGISQMECLGGDTFPEQYRVTQLVSLNKFVTAGEHHHSLVKIIQSFQLMRSCTYVVQ